MGRGFKESTCRRDDTASYSAQVAQVHLTSAQALGEAATQLLLLDCRQVRQKHGYWLSEDTGGGGGARGDDAQLSEHPACPWIKLG